MKQVHGWSFPDADQFMAGEIHADGGYQRGHLNAAMAHVKDWEVAVDAGAHCGTWTKPLSERFAHVIACEPAPDTFECLVANVRRFQLENVDLRNIAVGAEQGWVSMAPLEERAEALANTGARFVQPGGSIPCEAIDDWGLKSLNFLKLDIEGSECDAIKGAALTIKLCRPIILWECKGFWRRFGYAKTAPQELLTALGYRELFVVGCDRIWGPA